MEEKMLNEQPAKKKKDLLILGLGFAGTRLASKINRELFDVLVVDRKSFFEFSPSIISAFGNPQRLTSITVTPKDILKPGEFLQADLSLLSLSKAELKLPQGLGPEHASTLDSLAKKGWRISRDETQQKLEIQFDYCVVCIGSAYAAPIRSWASTQRERQAEIQAFGERIAQPNLEKVIVEGAGYVGVEAALRIKEITKKPVEMYVRSDTILRTIPQAGQDKARQLLNEKGVTVRFNRTVLPEEAAK